jgi:eukaryotic-like serine/threonine-protein kinase
VTGKRADRDDPAVTAPTVDSGANPSNSAAHQRLTELFGEALSLSATGRAAMLDRLREAEGEAGAQLAAELEELLRADASADTALNTGGLAPTVNLGPALSHAPGLSIPGYRLSRVLGEGGMGTVYAAEQESPRRQVAIKVLHARSPNALVRFRAEADIMARLDHPAIARVLEAGTADGHPYLVMEHVEGQTLDRYARSLGRERRLELFAELCDAIHHAHVKGVIHRDLKPSNVMVRPTGHVVVLDFGVARLATAEGSTPGDTRAGDLIGTPIYMSPEQARLQADQVDARSDVYTLGVILYELLCDELPYDVRGLALPAVTRLITEDEPRSLARRSPELRGDLDAICHKALRKAPQERYQSATALGDDVRRHLQKLPVSVRSPGSVEQLQRFVRRRPLVAATIGGAAFAVAAFAAIVTGLWLEARAARRTALREQARTELAHAELEARTNQLVLRQARAVVSRDPTEALAWLATLTDRELDVEAAWAVADEAIGRGVASEVWHAHEDEVHWVEPLAGGGFATAGYDGQVIAFDGPARSPRKIFQAEKGRILMARPAPDGARLAVGGEDGALHVVPRGGGAAVALTGHVGELQQVEWSADGARLVSGDDHGNVKMWPRGAAPAQELAAMRSSIGTLEMSAAGDAAIAGVDDGDLLVWHWERGGAPARAAGKIRGKPVGAWTDGRRALVVDGEGRVHRLRRDGEALVEEGAAVATGFPIKRAIFADDGSWIVLGGVGGSVLQVAGEHIDMIGAHRAQVRSLTASPDGALLATASDDGNVQVHDRRSGRHLTLLGHKARVRHLAFADGALLSADGDGTVRRWKLPETPSVLDAGGAPIASVVASADGSRLAAVATDGEVTTWTLETGARVRRGRVEGQPSALALDGEVPITGTIDGKLTWWRAGAPPLVRGVSGIVKAIRAGAAAGAKIAVGTSSGAVSLFSAGGEPLGEAVGHVEGTDALAWHPSGALLASGGQDRIVRLWRVDGQPALVAAGALDGLTGDTHFIEFSPSGDQLFAGDDDGMVVSWRLDGLRPLPGSRATLAQHGGAISAMAVARDGRVLATSGLDKAMTVVDLRSGRATTTPFGDVASALAFDAKDGLYAVTRAGALARATQSGSALLIEHGATAGAAIPPGKLAVALGDGAILIAPLVPRSFAALVETLTAATTYRLPTAATPAE